MSLFDAVQHRLRVLVHGGRYEHELDEEIRFHLALDEMQGAHAGLTAVDARYAARRRFGNVTYLKEETRRMAGLASLQAVRQDLAYASRTLRRAPGFTIAAVLTLALGIGSTTAVFSIVDGVLLRGLPYRDADSIVGVYEANEDGKGFRVASYPTFRDWQTQMASSGSPFDRMAFVRGDQATYRSDRGIARFGAGFVTPGFFQLLGTPALLGRTLAPEEEHSGGPSVVVISYDLWQQEFGGDPAVVGKRVDIDDAPRTIIGVMPRGFAYPTFAKLWGPIVNIEATDSALQKRGVHSDSRVIARLRQRSDSARAAASMRTVASRLALEHPAEQAHWTGISLQPIRDEVLGTTVQPMLLALTGAVLLVLLLACVNAANLALVRGAAREREIAVRSALGAGRGRVVRQLLTESLAVALVGGAVGVLVASLAVSAVRRIGAEQLPRANEIAIHGGVLAFALGVTIVTALLAGLVPALRATRPALVQQLRSGSMGAGEGLHDSRLRGALAAAQFALALVLLVGAGLLIQSFRRIESVPLGFDPDGLAALAISLPPKKYDEPAQAAALYFRLMEAVRAVPGVQDVAVTNHLPVGGGWVPSVVQIPGRPPRGADDLVLYRTASDTYLRTMRMSMQRGRWFTAEDMRSPTGFVINETMAKQFWPNDDPVGKPLTVHRSSQARPDFGQPINGVVLGVVRDVHQGGREQEVSAEIYVPYTQEVWPWITLVVRASAPERAIPALQRAVLDVDPAIPVRNGGPGLFGGFKTVNSLVSSTMAQRRFALSMVGTFAVCALLLAAIGMYGVISYGVAQRTREVGVRMALGATQRNIMRLILGEGLKLALIGAVVGLAGALASTRLIRAMLFATGATDPTTFVVTPLLLGAVAVVACYLPARRATRLDPTLAIRGE